MAQATLLAVGSTSATSSDITVAAGAVATIGIFATSGLVPSEARGLVYIDTPGGDAPIYTLTATEPAVVLSGPGTFRVVRRGTTGLSWGVWSES